MGLNYEGSKRVSSRVAIVPMYNKPTGKTMSYILVLMRIRDSNGEIYHHAIATKFGFVNPIEAVETMQDYDLNKYSEEVNQMSSAIAQKVALMSAKEMEEVEGGEKIGVKMRGK